MARYDFRSPRLYLDQPFGAGARVTLGRAAANYLFNVLRLRPGAAVLVFNGRDGEWRATVPNNTRDSALEIAEQVRTQPISPDLALWFAPLKHARLDYMVQKAVEMGVSELAPVITRHTQVGRVNLDRMRANAVEAAEQCGILTLPAIAAPANFDRVLAERAEGRRLVFCDEEAEVRDPIAALAPLAGTAGKPVALLVGPEGGFAGEERAALLRLPQVTRIALGPRILRADTAAVAALALIQASLGDWR